MLCEKCKKNLDNIEKLNPEILEGSVDDRHGYMFMSVACPTCGTTYIVQYRLEDISIDE